METKALSLPPDYASLPADIQADLQAYVQGGPQSDLGTMRPDFPRIDILHAGATAFRIGGEDGPIVKEFSGIIIHNHQQNAWWEKSMEDRTGEAETDRPDCWSIDGRRPDAACVKRQDEHCESCQKNQFGSDRSGGRGKDCKNMFRLYVILADETGGYSELPYRMALPPTSLPVWRAYITKLVSTFKLAPGVPVRPGLVLTKVKAVSASNKDGIAFTKPAFSCVRILNPQEIAASIRMMKVVQQHVIPPESADYASDRSQ